MPLKPDSLDPTLAKQKRVSKAGQRLDALLRWERALWEQGITRIAGVDEAGVGPLAGPVVAAAVVFAPGTNILGVDDSKRIAPLKRTALATEIQRCALDIGIGIAQVDEIDQLNIYHATHLAMQRAVAALQSPPQHLLVDARTLLGTAISQEAFIKGDSLHFSIAAASIIAKTHRDRLMVALDQQYPGYGLAQHKGYGTAAHQAALKRLGPCPIHRQSYAAVRRMLLT